MRAPDELFRAEITQGTVRPDGIVVQPPGFDQLFGFFQIAEPVLVQAFVPQPAVEALDVRVLDRLAGLNEVQLHSLAVGPGIQGGTGELRAVIDRNCFGKPAELGQPIQHLGYPKARQ